MMVFCRICDDSGCMLCDGEYERLEYESLMEEIEEELRQREESND